MRSWIPPLAAVLYWSGVALRAWLMKKHLGRSPHLRPRSAKEKVLWAGWALVVAGWLLSPLFVRSSVLDGPISLACGTAAVLAGLGGTVWSHRAMGDSWRVGTGAGENTPLVTEGPYRWLRHPIYAFQCLILFGVLLLAPSPVMLCAVFFHRILVSVKIRDEERSMESLHGSIYKEYARRTGSLWPKFNRV